jgi:hypothetical protein
VNAIDAAKNHFHSIVRFGFSNSRLTSASLLASLSAWAFFGFRRQLQFDQSAERIRQTGGCNRASLCVGFSAAAAYSPNGKRGGIPSQTNLVMHISGRRDFDAMPSSLVCFKARKGAQGDAPKARSIEPNSANGRLIIKRPRAVPLDLASSP